MTHPSQLVLIFITLPFFLLLPAKGEVTPSNEASEPYSFADMAPEIKKWKWLVHQDAELGWNYDPTKGNATVEFFFGAKPSLPTGWVAWGINPGAHPQMVGTRAVIVFREPNGTLFYKTYNITGDMKRRCAVAPSPLDLDLRVRKLNYTSGFITMSVVATLPGLDLSRLNHVWQVGAYHDGKGVPYEHSLTLEHFDSREIIDLRTGRGMSSAAHRRRLRKLHGVLAIVGWGTLLPFGIIVARYFKEYPFLVERWFRFHIGCQITAVFLGTLGWAIGISLGNSSKNYGFHNHRILGCLVFAMAMVQVLALWLKPKKTDEFRQYWHMYHHFLGYALFALAAVNIFKGIRILSPTVKWKWVYVSILSALGFVVLCLEIITWSRFIFERFILPRWEPPEKKAEATAAAPKTKVSGG